MNTKVMPEDNQIYTDNAYAHKNRNQEETKAYRKANIPKALREQVWIKYMKNRLHGKCVIVWCKNKMSAFDFHVGHDIPESKGGTLDITNLRPICSRCNLSMSNNYTISEWEALQGFPRKWWHRFICK